MNPLRAIESRLLTILPHASADDRLLYAYHLKMTPTERWEVCQRYLEEFGEREVSSRRKLSVCRRTLRGLRRLRIRR